MPIGPQIMAWRRAGGWTQSALARRANLTRAYLSRLEGGSVDPALSSVRRLASAMGLRLSQILEESPSHQKLDRHELDRLARAAIRPGTKEAKGLPEGRILARFILERRRALGLFVPHKQESAPATPAKGRHAARWLRASLGEDQWGALLKRIDKLASLYAAR